MKSLFLTFATSILLSCNTTKVVEQKQLFQKIDSLVQTKNPRTFNGVVVISKEGKNIYEKAYGFSNAKNQTKLSPDDRFSSMSIAKQITATLVMLEVEKGTISLNQPINIYLKDLKYDWANKVTVHHLLNNSSGIDAWQLKEELLFEPGTQFKYSNIGYAMLGKILESATGKSYEQLVTELFGRCGMKSSFYPNTINQKSLVNSYAITKDGTNLVKEFPYSAELYPGSHLIVTAGDLAKWNNLLHNGKILKDESYQKMIHYSITDIHTLFSEKEIGYGYGLRINDKADVFEIGHTGFSPPAGFTAVNLYYPKKKISVTVLENQATDNFDIAYYFEQEIRNTIVKSNLVK
ncbi:serine hydrolase domain-containing protein [Chryseobacterium gambrini]|uniref:Serine hydrolase domain-containing protein n=1 Tax=Chryseobacterium gambrini TaxID=373672 RepID=A0AAJ1VIF1_9FLAO|nr:MULTISPECIES: serine hydrolase domain-containing protein [Chryseobacterium]MDN4011088.1 serine hydrolase domain-containing protein [Chryseobacterium gambrini]MDN4028329.1 serine hydrolase domain-containing protein [Chryseobacterium gambrini]QWA38740.1 beta-lactamase family protein [Chryseobacterium sp. ZHDP1]